MLRGLETRTAAAEAVPMTGGPPARIDPASAFLCRIVG